MENQRYLQDGVDLKRMFLLFKKKVWLVIAAVVAGALVGGGGYLLYHLVLAPEREYQSVSKIYLNFDCEPEDYNQLAYNGYTWNDLMVTDPILDYTMEALPEKVTKETVIAATKAEILSDIRLLTITITAGEPELVAQIMEATQKALVHLGETDELFHSIEVYSTTEPQQIVWDNRTVRAVVTGAVLALFVALMVLAFYYVLDDSVYVMSDAEKRYGVPVLGIFTGQKAGAEQPYGKEFLANYRYMSRNRRSVALVSADDKSDAEAVGQMIRQLMECAGAIEVKAGAGDTAASVASVNAGNIAAETSGAGDITAKTGVAADNAGNSDKAKAGFENVELHVCDMPEKHPSVYEQMRKTDGVMLTVRYGSGNGKRVERMLSQLEKQDCPVLGMVIADADENFLKLYYMGKKNNKRV